MALTKTGKKVVANNWLGNMPLDHQGEKPMTVRFRMLTPVTKEAMNRLNPTP